MDGELQNRGRGGGGQALRASASGNASSGDKGSKAKAKEEVLARIAGKGAGADDYNARAIRHSLRVFIATGALMKLWGIVSARVLGKKQGYVNRSLYTVAWLFPRVGIASYREANMGAVVLPAVRSNRFTSRPPSGYPYHSAPSC